MSSQSESSTRIIESEGSQVGSGLEWLRERALGSRQSRFAPNLRISEPTWLRSTQLLCLIWREIKQVWWSAELPWILCKLSENAASIFFFTFHSFALVYLVCSIRFLDSNKEGSSEQSLDNPAFEFAHEDPTRSTSGKCFTGWSPAERQLTEIARKWG